MGVLRRALTAYTYDLARKPAESLTHFAENMERCAVKADLPGSWSGADVLYHQGDRLNAVTLAAIASAVRVEIARRKVDDERTAEGGAGRSDTVA